MATQGAISLKRELGFWHLLVFGIVYIGPISSFTMFGFVDANSAGAVVPSFIIAAVALGLTALSYGKMAEVEPSAGSVFSYARLAMGPVAGFIAGWAILLDYLLLASLVALYAGIFLNAAFPMVATEAWLGGFLLLGLVINVLGIRWSLGAEILVAGIQFLFCTAFVIGGVAALTSGAGTPAPVWPDNVPLTTIVTGASVAVITYLGFDAVVTLTEEVKGTNPGRKSGRVGLIAILFMMLLFIGISWLLSSLGQGLTFDDPSTSAWVVINERVPELAWALSLVAGLALGIGGTTTIHVGVSRLIMGMARESHLPSMLATVHPRTHVPWVATVTSMGVITVVAYVALPHVDLLGGLVSFGALLAFLFVNLSVVVWFGVRHGSRKWVLHWALPLLGALVVGYVLAGIKPMAIEVGIAWLVSGLVLYFVMRRGTATRRGSPTRG